jgi:hypothetical protein
MHVPALLLKEIVLTPELPLDMARQKEQSSKILAMLRENRVFESFLSCGYFAGD